MWGSMMLSLLISDDPGWSHVLQNRKFLSPREDLGGAGLWPAMPPFLAACFLAAAVLLCGAAYRSCGPDFQRVRPTESRLRARLPGKIARPADVVNS